MMMATRLSDLDRAQYFENHSEDHDLRTELGHAVIAGRLPSGLAILPSWTCGPSSEVLAPGEVSDQATSWPLMADLRSWPAIARQAPSSRLEDPRPLDGVREPGLSPRRLSEARSLG